MTARTWRAWLDAVPSTHNKACGDDVGQFVEDRLDDVADALDDRMPGGPDDVPTIDDLARETMLRAARFSVPEEFDRICQAIATARRIPLDDRCKLGDWLAAATEALRRATFRDSVQLKIEREDAPPPPIQMEQKTVARLTDGEMVALRMLVHWLGDRREPSQEVRRFLGTAGGALEKLLLIVDTQPHDLMIGGNNQGRGNLEGEQLTARLDESHRMTEAVKVRVPSGSGTDTLDSKESPIVTFLMPGSRMEPQAKPGEVQRAVDEALAASRLIYGRQRVPSLPPPGTEIAPSVVVAGRVESARSAAETAELAEWRRVGAQVLDILTENLASDIVDVAVADHHRKEIARMDLRIAEIKGTLLAALSGWKSYATLLPTNADPERDRALKTIEQLWKDGGLP